MEEIVFEAMGTTISLAIVHDKAKVLLTEAKRRLLDYEERFSANDPDSLLMRVNDLAGLTIVSKSSLVGEIYTSLYFNLTSQDLLAKLSATSGVEAVIITRDGDVVLTEGIKP